jgi:hypothetical protein
MKTVTVCAFAVCLTAATAGAAMTSQFDFAQPQTSWLWGKNVSFPQFDPTSGTLEKVTISLTSSATGFAGLENTTGELGLADLSASLDVFVKDGGATLLSATPIQGSHPRALVQPYDGATDWSGTSGFNTGNLAGTASNVFEITSAAGLDRYLGNGNVTFWFANAEHLNIGSSIYNPMPLGTFSHSSDATLQVTYTYTPEPASLALLALGGLAGLGRRRTLARA